MKCYDYQSEFHLAGSPSCPAVHQSMFTSTSDVQCAGFAALAFSDDEDEEDDDDDIINF